MLDTYLGRVPLFIPRGMLTARELRRNFVPQDQDLHGAHRIWTIVVMSSFSTALYMT